MELAGISLITLIIYATLIFLAFKFLKSILKTVLIGILLLGLIFGTGGFLIYQDIMDLKDNINDAEKLVLIGDDNTILSGIMVKSIDDQNFTFLSDKKIEEIDEYYKEKEYESILKDNYKFILIKVRAFDSVIEKGINMEEFGFDKPLYIDKKVLNRTIYADDPLNILFDELSKSFMDEGLNSMIPEELITQDMVDSMKDDMKNNLKTQIGIKDDNQFKAMLFGMLLKNKVEQSGIIELVKDYKKEDIIIYPQTTIFKIIKIIPTDVIQEQIQKFNSSVSLDNY